MFCSGRDGKSLLGNLARHYAKNREKNDIVRRIRGWYGGLVCRI